MSNLTILLCPNTCLQKVKWLEIISNNDLSTYMYAYFFFYLNQRNMIFYNTLYHITIPSNDIKIVYKSWNLMLFKLRVKKNPDVFSSDTVKSV